MQLAAIGLSHKRAPVEVRELLACPPARQEAALTGLLGCAAEGVILSTCNRMEVYAVLDNPAAGPEDLAAFVGDFNGLTPDAFVPYLYHLRGEEVVEHLFAVASGLDSMIIGEPQILGQVRDAYETASACGATGPILSWIFSHALKAGKQVRSETEITRSAVSISYAAVELARKVFGSLTGRSILVVGAGKMGELAARTLSDHGLSDVVVTNRTFARAAQLAERFGGLAAEFDRLPELVERADVVVTSTGAPGFVLTPTLVKQAMHGRRNRPLFVIDIAVPRDVDPLVQRLDNVFLYDIDDLQAVCAANLEERRREVARAQKIIDAEMAAYRAWWANLGVVPTISSLRRRAEEIRQSELKKALGRMGELSERQQSTLDALTTAIVNKLLHQPITRLKTQAEMGGDGQYVRVTRELFGLDEDR